MIEKIIQTLNIKDPKLIEFIENNLLCLKKVELKEYSDFIIYLNNKNDIVLQYNIKKGYLFTTYEVWSMFEKFGYRYTEVSNFIKDIVEKTYKLNNIVITSYYLINITELMNQWTIYKSKGITDPIFY